VNLNNNEEKIENFEQYLKEQLQAIEQLSAPKHETLFKKKLYISFLESLAKATFPEEGVKRRLMKFLEKFTSWKEWDYCCPIYLQNKEKRQHILDTKWYVKIESVAIFNENIEEYKGTYAYLLYEARNTIVHQLQSSTEWEESTLKNQIESPFYEVTTSLVFDENLKKLKGDKKHIELIFPNTFLKKLSEEGLKKYIKYCRDKQVNPFEYHYAERIIYEENI